MSARSERDQLRRELEAARKRIADLETALLRRGRDTLTAVLRIEAFRTAARMSHGDAFHELTRCAARQFDPEVTAALVARFDRQRAGRTLHLI